MVAVAVPAVLTVCPVLAKVVSVPVQLSLNVALATIVSLVYVSCISVYSGKKS
jgi:hypothetical protein